jgi:hypothetical protein
MISVTRGIAATATFRNAFSSAVGVMTIDYRRDYYAGEWPRSGQRFDRMEIGNLRIKEARSAQLAPSPIIVARIVVEREAREEDDNAEGYGEGAEHSR